MTDNTHKNAIEFIPAICPNCGGELRVPENRNLIKCMYCGYDIIMHDPSKYDNNQAVQNFIKLAQVAENSKNHTQAYHYYGQALENDASNIEAWLGRASNALFALPSDVSLDQVISCSNEILNLSQEENIKTQIVEIINYTCALECKISSELLAKEMRFANEQNLPLYHVTDDSVCGFQTKRVITLRKLFLGLAQAWDIKPNQETGILMYELIRSLWEGGGGFKDKFQRDECVSMVGEHIKKVSEISYKFMIDQGVDNIIQSSNPEWKRPPLPNRRVWT